MEANLQIANILAGMLVANGDKVVLTRTTNKEGPTNTQRAQIANNAGAHVLVSIHLNGSTDHTMNYTQAFYGKQTKDLEFTRVMHAAQWPALGIDDGGIGNFASGVLLKSNMPATLTESVFLSNTEECADLKSGKIRASGQTRQEEIASSLYNGIQNWFSQQTEGGGGGSGKGKPSR